MTGATTTDATIEEITTGVMTEEITIIENHDVITNKNRNRSA
jgi:hypothetical protein